MEDFINNIYQNSLTISNFKEFVFLINSGRFKQARALYNETALKLEKWLETIALSDPSTATLIQKIAITSKDCYGDPCQCKGIIEGQLLPMLYKYMTFSNTIDVSEGKYTLRSSDTGFLTILDKETNEYIHDIHDPMHEAYQIINSIYKPEMEGFTMLGCGLGYEAYQVYHQSGGAVRIYLYEEDETILDYASLYGVLSLIPDANLEVIHESDFEKLADKFLKRINSSSSFGYYISPFKKKIYNGVCGNELNRIIINQDYLQDSSYISTINFWKNKQLNSIPFADITSSYSFNEYIVISAGPSLDDSLEFLRDSKGTRGLIAVNTVLRRLLNEGILPDILVAADPAEDMSRHIAGIESSATDITLIADWLLSWKYTSQFKGRISFVRTNASAVITEDFLPKEPVWDISGTVACLGIETAVNLGAKKIYLVGQDLAYPSGKMYAKGMPHDETVKNAKWDIQVPSVNGQMVYSCEAFEWFRKAIEFQIKKYNNIEFFNLSKNGALIKGASFPSNLQ